MLGAALKTLIAKGRTGPTFGIVHPFSTHSFALRYWLAACGIDPDRDVRLVVVPPPYAVEALESGQVDGFCVGEPWNNVAAERGSGVVALAVSQIWQASPCKVLGLRRDFAERWPARVAALVRAVTKAAEWADRPENRESLAVLLSAPDLVGVHPAIIERSLAGTFAAGAGGAPERVPGFIAFSREGATFPSRDHALWFYSQMVRWGQIQPSRDAETTAAESFRRISIAQPTRPRQAPVRAGERRGRCERLLRRSNLRPGRRCGISRRLPSDDRMSNRCGWRRIEQPACNE